MGITDELICRQVCGKKSNEFGNKTKNQVLSKVCDQKPQSDDHQLPHLDVTKAKPLDLISPTVSL